MLTPYDRFNPFREMRRMLDAMEAAMTRSLAPSDGLLTPVDASPLALDITTDENNVVVRTAVPGVQGLPVGGGGLRVEHGVTPRRRR